MSDPYHGQTPDKDNLDLDKKGSSSADNNAAEKAAAAEKSSAADAASKQALNAASQGAPVRQEQSDPKLEATLAKIDLTFNFSGMSGQTLGSQMPYLQLKTGAQSAPESDRKIGALKPLISEFLKNTDVETKTSLTDAELRQLTYSRQALASATNMQEAVSDALHLARLYQHMRYIEEAKKAIDLSLGIDPHNYYGKQLFGELEKMHPADLGAAAATTIKQPLTKNNLRKRILSLTGGRVIVLGDLIIDELLEGKPERISREAPVLILEHVDTELIPGGAANTANNIAALGGLCHAIGVCGQDEYAKRLELLFDQSHITHGLVRDPSRPTTVKTRILSKSHSFKQQLLRLDRISHEPIDEAIERQLLEKLASAAPNYGALVLSDYRAGVMTDGLIRVCRTIAAEQGLFLIVDAQDDFPRYQNVSLLTPNEPDVEKALGYTLDSQATLAKAGEELLMITGAQALLITRGGKGMVLFTQSEPMVLMPAFNRSEVFDVTGAGDTVVAVMALALVTGASNVEAMALGNLAAGLVVKKPGTAVTSQKEMLESLDLLKLEEE